MSVKTFLTTELIERRGREGSRLGRAVIATLGIILGATAVNYSGMAAGPPAIVTAPNGTPQSTAVNTIFQVALVAWVRDAGTNPVPGVTVTFTAPGSGASASFGGSAAAQVVTDGSGLATAPTLTANGEAGSFVLTASVPGVPTAATFNLTNTGSSGTVVPAAPTNFRLVSTPPGSALGSIVATAGSPQNARINTGFATALQATVRDANSNPQGGVSVTFSAPATGAGATFNGAPTATAVTNASGVATAPALTANGVTGCYAVTANAPGVSASANFALTNVPGSGGGCGVWTNITPPQVPTGGAGGNNCDYGTLSIVVDQQTPTTLYLGTCEHGIFKSVNSGTSWTKINTGANSAILDRSRQWTLAMDPTNSQVLYTNSGYGGEPNNGAWKSVNGGVDWQMIWPPPSQPSLWNIVEYNFVAQVYLDPTDHLHVFLSWHGSCAAPYTPVCYGESRDAGATWTIRNGDPRWQASEAQTIYIIDGQRWLFANHADGLWRTGNAGATWTLISSQGAGHWPSQLYQSSTGVFYIGADTGIYRSPDGISWSLLPNTRSLVNGLVGDGTTIYASWAGALTPWVAVGTNPYLTSPESDGITWTAAPWAVPPGAFTQGAGAGMAYDRVNHFLYSSNGTFGLWRVATQ